MPTKRYKIRIIMGDIDFPKNMQLYYAEFIDAYNALCDFVHQYTNTKKIDASIMDTLNDYEDIEYISSY